MKLNQFKLNKNYKTLKKRICRGIGTGKGKTGGKGHKGQKSRSGYKKNIRFEGGQTPIYRKLPKYGTLKCKNNKKNTKIIKLSYINKLKLNDYYKLDLDYFINNGIIKKRIKNIKILFDEDINKKIILIKKNISFSNKVKNSIEKIGGKFE